MQPFWLIAAFLSLAVACGLNWHYAGSLKYPPAVFCGIWALVLGALIFSGDTLYPVSPKTLLVYVVGALSFSLGGLLVRLRPSTARVHWLSRARSRFGRWVLWAGLAMGMIGVPFFWDHAKELSAASGAKDIFYGVRLESVRRADLRLQGASGDLKDILLNNVITFSIIIALIATSEGHHSRACRIRSFLAIAVALALSVLSASSASAAVVLFSAVGVAWVRRRRLNKKLLLISVIIFAVLFGLVAVLVRKGNTDPNSSLADNLESLVELFQVYGLGGAVAFDQVVQNPGAIPPNWSIWRFFQVTANKLGADFAVPSLHAEYTLVSPAVATNVYTMYFAYFPDYGWWGVVLVLAILGIALCWVYREAIAGNPVAVVLYGAAFSGILLSAFNEQFFNALNFHLKQIAVLWLLYGLPASLKTSRARRSPGWEPRLSGPRYTLGGARVG